MTLSISASERREARAVRSANGPAMIAYSAVLRGLMLGLCLVALAGCTRSGNSQTATASPADASGASAAAQASAPPFLGKGFPSQGHAHLNPGEPDDFNYNSNPPTSGPHREIFTDTFISPEPIPNYVQVHLLEHGNVLLQYNCTCPDLATQLGSIAMIYDIHLIPPSELQPSAADVQNGEEQGMAVIVAPYPRMKSTIALTAWTRLGTLTAVDKQKIVSFIDAYLHNEANASQ
jgi:hypothetical protein